MLTMTTKMQSFVVVAISDNTNSFGLWGHVVVNQQGHAYQIGLNYMRKRHINDVMRIPVSDDMTPQWHLIGAEIPQRLDDMPKEFLAKVKFV